MGKEIPNAIYFLNKIDDDPRFEGFAFANKTSLLGHLDIYRDFAPFNPQRRDWQPARLKDLWKAREVIGNVRPTNDFPMIVEIPAFSQRAVDALRDLLEPNGELLPLKMAPGLGNYYAFNTTTIVDALDLKRSEITLLGGYVAFRIPRYEFVIDKLKGLSVFRIPDRPSDVYVTEEFASRVREHDLQGFHLMQVWPMPAGVDWYKFGMQQIKKMAGRPKTPEQAAPRRTPTGKVTSRPPRVGEEADSLAKAIKDYPTELGVDILSMTVEDAQRWILDQLIDLRNSGEIGEAKVDRAFWLGIAWGESVVRDCGWHWAMLEDQANHKTLALVSPNRSHAVPALAYVSKIARDSTGDATTYLLYNMVKAGKLPPAKPQEHRLIN